MVCQQRKQTKKLTRSRVVSVIFMYPEKKMVHVYNNYSRITVHVSIHTCTTDYKQMSSFMYKLCDMCSCIKTVLMHSICHPHILHVHSYSTLMCIYMYIHALTMMCMFENYLQCLMILFWFVDTNIADLALKQVMFVEKEHV